MPKFVQFSTIKDSELQSFLENLLRGVRKYMEFLQLERSVIIMIETDLRYLSWSNETNNRLQEYIANFRRFHKSLRKTSSYEVPVSFPGAPAIINSIPRPEQEMNARYARLFQNIIKSTGFTNEIGEELGLMLL